MRFLRIICTFLMVLLLLVVFALGGVAAFGMMAFIMHKQWIEACFWAAFAACIITAVVAMGSVVLSMYDTDDLDASPFPWIRARHRIRELERENHLLKVSIQNLTEYLNHPELNTPNQITIINEQEERT